MRQAALAALGQLLDAAGRFALVVAALLVIVAILGWLFASPSPALDCNPRNWSC